ncbi:GNAT family N-acetyltransferase [Aquihabitans sp. G128]|uniref:GNAT family N-acetyltransferase n=1 Tax=Aquihabitans sp. G128 TaxID=2849779 RepID=UPI001C234CF9|nr:GNAT family protein [Aquihabitans sp. G128]QXC59518.1 GNAT family N-acetyltransferase [Aquihabitans sp. G128]
MDAERTVPDGLEVRGSRREDAAGFVALMEAVAAEGRWIGRELPLDHDERREAFLAGIEDPEHLSLVVVRSEEVVGSLGLHHDGIGHAELGMLLAADVRGRGVGSALLAQAIAWADAHPVVHKVTLQAWPHNAAALALYRRHGFTVEGVLRRHWRRRDGELWDAVVMGLPVTDRQA